MVTAPGFSGSARPYKVNLDAGAMQDPRGLRRATEDSFCVAVLGDFTGNRSPRSTGAREGPWLPIRVTPENMVDLAGLRPALRLGWGGEEHAALELEFQALESFHPDHLFRRLPLFQGLREARRNAEEGVGAPDTASTGPPEGGVEGPPPGDAPARPDPRESGQEGLLERILEGQRAGDPIDDLGAFVRQIVRPHLVEDTTDRAGAIAQVDAAASSLMRKLLHHQQFQALESLWRSVVFLLSRVDTTRKVRVYIVDVGLSELEEDLGDDRALESSRLARLLLDPPLGPDRRWGLVVGTYPARGTPDEIRLLERIARIVRVADVPWVGSGSPWLAGCASLDDTPDPADWPAQPPAGWALLRARPEAAWLGLALPRFLVREAYGRDGRRCRAFAFEEAPEGGEDLLLGSGAVVCAALAAGSFASRGQGSPSDVPFDLVGVPLPPVEAGLGRPPCPMEWALTSAAARRLQESGMMPLLAYPGEARIRVGGLISVAEPSRRLHAWWTR